MKNKGKTTILQLHRYTYLYIYVREMTKSQLKTSAFLPEGENNFPGGGENKRREQKKERKREEDIGRRK